MKLDGYCPGCGGGAGNQGCLIARCSIDHGGYQYCFECKEYPCTKYDGITEYDSFITHRNQLLDMEKANSKGITVTNDELIKKNKILRFLLDNYNDGRRKTFFCIAVNLLELQDLHTILDQIHNMTTEGAALKDKAIIAVECFENVAKQKGIELKMHKKGNKKLE
jgi:hypothetical protein